MRHTIKVLLIGAALAALSGTAAARDNVSFGIAIGAPAPVYVAPPPEYYYPPPVYYGAPVYAYYGGYPYRGWDARFHHHGGYHDGGYHHGWHGHHGR